MIEIKKMQYANQLLNTFTAGEILAFSSLVIAVLALITTVWQAYTTRKHNILSVKPHIALDIVTIVSKEPKVIINNNGAGTAYIRYINIEYKGQFFTLNSKKSVHSLLKSFELTETDLHRFIFFPGQLSLTPNSSKEILAFPVSKHDVNFSMNKSLIEKLYQLKIYVVYSCIYNKTYSSSSNFS